MIKNFILLLLLICSTVAKADEGMYPLSAISKLDLKKAGLRMPVNSLYNPNGVSTIDALVRLGGCTGSFVSAEGLIVTNHHCAFGATAAASTVQNDYITNGYLAKNKGEEIPAKGLTVKITVGYLDVSAEITAIINPLDEPSKRIDKVRAKIKEIEKREKASNPTLEVEISEMFPFKQYVLFKYQTIKDIRLVYVPPRAIGEFGGESDNWVWPRHNGDFSFVRAYVSPDGSAAAYNTQNVPFRPKSFLKINPNGTKENDFVFVLGYPGRTQRHYPASFLNYQYKNVLPTISRTYDWLIENELAIGKNDKAKAIAFSSEIKSLANVTKNYKGKMQGIQRIQLIQQKLDEEALLTQWINSDKTRSSKWGNTLNTLNVLYGKLSETAPRDLWLNLLIGQSASISAAIGINTIKANYFNAPKNTRDSLLKADVEKLIPQIQTAYSPFDPKVEMDYLNWMFDQYLKNSYIHDKFVAINPKAVELMKHFSSRSKWKTNSVFLNPTVLIKMLKENPKQLLKLDDQWLISSSILGNTMQMIQLERKNIDGQINSELPNYLDAKIAWKESTFIPDANATLRLTYGYVRGYQPRDGEYNIPYTTVKGIFEKGEPEGDYILPKGLSMAYQMTGLDNYKSKPLNDIPVALLYNLDTTGGNSGSPILDADGNLIGVNFDRAYTATINDYAWNESYSRSIGVDIRYILFVLEKYAEAGHLVKEMELVN